MLCQILNLHRILSSRFTVMTFSKRKLLLKLAKARPKNFACDFYCPKWIAILCKYSLFAIPGPDKILLLEAMTRAKSFWEKNGCRLSKPEISWGAPTTAIFLGSVSGEFCSTRHEFCASIVGRRNEFSAILVGRLFSQTANFRCLTAA